MTGTHEEGVALDAIRHRIYEGDLVAHITRQGSNISVAERKVRELRYDSSSRRWQARLDDSTRWCEVYNLVVVVGD